MDLRPSHNHPIQAEKKDAPQADEDIRKRMVRHTFSELAQEFAFFTPALLQTHGNFDRDPVAEFVQYHPSTQDLSPKAIDCPMPIFEGLRVTQIGNLVYPWPNRLYLCPHPCWPALRDFIAGISFMHSPSQYLARVLFTEIQMLDHIAVMRGTVFVDPPTFPVTVFVVASNRFYADIDPGDKISPGVLPKARVRPARQADIDAAKEVFASELSAQVLHSSQKDRENYESSLRHSSQQNGPICKEESCDEPAK